MDVWLIHGICGCIALLLILPLGIVKLWSRNRPWPVPHWAIQSFGTILLMNTSALGLLNSSGLHHVHQALGLGVSMMVLIQMILGYANAIRSHAHATYIYVAHSSLGFSTLLLGWLTMLSGFRLASVASTPFIFVALLSAAEIFSLIGGSLFVRWRAQNTGGRTSEGRRGHRPASELYDLAEGGSEEDEDVPPYEDKTRPGQSTSLSRGSAAV